MCSGGGPNISKYKDPWETNNFRGVHIFQPTCEIYVPGGPNISKYKDRGEPFGGGVQIFHDRPLNNLARTFQACHLCTFNVSAIFLEPSLHLVCHDNSKYCLPSFISPSSYTVLLLWCFLLDLTACTTA